MWRAVSDSLRGSTRGLPLKMCAETGLELQSLWNPGSLEDKRTLHFSFSPPSLLPSLSTVVLGTNRTASLSSTAHGSWPHHCCAQVIHLSLSGLPLSHDHSAAAPATTSQQLPSVYEFIFPGDELINSTILYEPGHRASVFGSSARPLYSSAESREHGMLSTASITASSLGKSVRGQAQH